MASIPNSGKATTSACLIACATKYIPDAEVYGLEETFSTHQYRVWSFEQLQNRYEKLHGDEKQFVDEALENSGVLPLMMADGIVHSDLFDGFTPPVIKNGATDARIRYLLDKGEKAGML